MERPGGYAWAFCLYLNGEVCFAVQESRLQPVFWHGVRLKPRFLEYELIKQLEICYARSVTGLSDY